jgi:hypothetical protein
MCHRSDLSDLPQTLLILTENCGLSSTMDTGSDSLLLRNFSRPFSNLWFALRPSCRLRVSCFVALRIRSRLSSNLLLTWRRECRFPISCFARLQQSLDFLTLAGNYDPCSAMIADCVLLVLRNCGRLPSNGWFAWRPCCRQRVSCLAHLRQALVHFHFSAIALVLVVTRRLINSNCVSCIDVAGCDRQLCFIKFSACVLTVCNMLCAMAASAFASNVVVVMLTFDSISLIL